MQPEPPIEQVVVFLMAFLASAMLIWGTASIAAAYICRLRFLPDTVHRALKYAVNHFGTKRARRILQSHALRTSAALTVMTACTVPPALAAPALPTPDIATHLQTQSSTPEQHSPVLPVTHTRLSALPTPEFDTSPEHQNQGQYGSTYTVVPGDSLWSISEAYHPQADLEEVTQAMWDLYEANAQVIGNNPDLIHPGMVLHLPTSDKELS